jgi:hypothetical protein
MKKYIEEALKRVKEEGFIKINNNQSYQIYCKGTIRAEIDIKNERIEIKETTGGRV